MNEVADIYNNLFSFESKKRTTAYPIHKKLDLGVHHADLVDWLFSKVEFNAGDRVLDAGCGSGYTLIKLAKEKGILGVGISISENEIDFSNQQAITQKIEKKISFQKTSFDSPISSKYDHIIAIESLKHCNDLEFTLTNLCQSLSPNGRLIIADDFSKTSGSKLLMEHVKLWNSLSYFSKGHLIKTLTSIRDFNISSYDLTDSVPLRPYLILQTLIFLVKFLGFCSSGGLKRNLKTYLGGLLLEKLYLRKEMNYMVFIIN
ncbi:MAG: methyltransferase domain-containing protein [Cyclobacteriaceae bacterium]